MALQTIALGGGCFWCTEAVFGRVRGVAHVESGYANGNTPAPSYEQVCRGDTGHAEVVRLRFDPAVIGLRELLAIFFATHDPCTRNRQGNDVGPQYRSGVYFDDPEHGAIARDVIRELEQDRLFDAPITTEVQPLTNYSAAEDCHQDYFAHHPQQAYCTFVVAPKVGKLRQRFARYIRN
ncbi:peptide-methionine (S)-S-oxide reductase [Verminephrobacter aporrectodeae subsp. tuberculatae]|uniref:peptide-methionine (S)-S-oxide reductase MsrA n=1 Tax=Verminephrobacter aporrectodeae TaxID=1110389 RepID=UPI00224474B8|nr:peptide-methionine (S)-S-oxide reductase MsrA [Verminephrobacter aporrectodeae]MCW8163911.1 peptide-methionine (S)-S-oxide reductase [Verminephrobacter aporrectodeae subsp. tuberculatae]MCW8168145.1 peptide-methionine (S)-S-oxide reductase [Verminephrobacter aporrectodeae subsp. tuberculatae]